VKHPQKYKAWLQALKTRNGAINRMSEGNKPSEVLVSALINGHLSSLAHVPEECQDAVNEQPGRFDGLM
jgi:hypothetical protein